LMQLKPVTFRWNNNQIDNSSKHLGFIAQDLQEVIPEVVVDSQWVGEEGSTKSWQKAPLLGVNYADENSIDKVKIGQIVYIKLNTNKNKIYNGKISEILSAFDNQLQSFVCKATFEETIDNSLFGTQLEANILVDEKKNALLIPRNYVGFGNKVNVKGKDEAVIIKTGIVSTDYVEVLEGVNKTDLLLPLKP
ncbi:tail fiber domain-containing protein, partial [Flavobacterium sp.]|uniref:tail fiber domain-containing protein n=1 Tax=Flavobacterium sp. TaxID=239 RepID=UPI0035B065B6